MPVTTDNPADAKGIRPSGTIEFPEKALAELRARIAAARWPDKETVADQSQGVQLEILRALARYWAKEYDWRKAEARLNALRQFVTKIDGLDIHFIHLRSRHDDALPLIVTHGWPGSIVEQLKIVDPLTDPTAHGASARDAFHLVIPALPGYGFSGKPTTPGWDPARIARAWVVLMRRLGYTRFVAQGGDWGALVTDLMGHDAAPELAGIHSNMPCAVPPDIHNRALTGAPAPAGLSAEEQYAYERLSFFYTKGLGYALEMANRPQTLYAIADSPVGLAAWMLDHDARSYELMARAFAGNPGGLTREGRWEPTGFHPPATLTRRVPSDHRREVCRSEASGRGMSSARRARARRTGSRRDRRAAPGIGRCPERPRPRVATAPHRRYQPAPRGTGPGSGDGSRASPNAERRWGRPEPGPNPRGPRTAGGEGSARRAPAGDTSGVHCARPSHPAADLQPAARPEAAARPRRPRDCPDTRSQAVRPDETRTHVPGSMPRREVARVRPRRAGAPSRPDLPRWPARTS